MNTTTDVSSYYRVILVVIDRTMIQHVLCVTKDHFFNGQMRMLLPDVVDLLVQQWIKLDER